MTTETSSYVHPEWVKENSLTSPDDRNPDRTYRPEQKHPSLTEEETDEVLKTNNNIDFLVKFPYVERKYIDPMIPLQRIGLISFVPAKGATPNKSGVFGFAKLRGNFCTTIEANEKAEELIRNVDSYHQIYHSYVGRPFPLTTSSKYSAETTEIDIRKEMTESISSNILQKKKDEQTTMNEIKEREEKLIEESKREEEDPYETYITNRVKLAQIGFTYIETVKKLEEMKNIIFSTRTLLEDMDTEYTEFKERYLGKYMKAREDAGIKENSPNNFIMYLGSDLKEELGF